MATSVDAAPAYEAEHVHEVYQEIASHFSSTRYKPWPIVESFLQGLPPGSVGLDAGCGNGKYMTVNNNIFIIGSDRSSNLIDFASQHPPHSAIVADSLSLPHPLHTFDFAISIAVIHHLSTPARRVEAVQALLETLKQDGRALVFVWALEQKDSRRGWDEGHEQDVMVPWVRKVGQPKTTGKKKKKVKEQQETNTDRAHQDGRILAQDEDNQHSNPNLLDAATSQPTPTEQTFHRYYHLYKRGELEEDIQAAGGVVIDSGYEKDNWWAIFRRI